jgi:hypothetical protein
MEAHEDSLLSQIIAAADHSESKTILAAAVEKPALH